MPKIKLKFIFIFLNFLLFSNYLFGQDSKLDSSIRQNTDTSLQIVKSTKEYILKIIELKSILVSLKSMHKPLFELSGNYLNVGYAKYGINSFEIGISHGKRNLFSPMKFAERHLNLIYATKYNSNYKGISVGFSKSNALFYKGIEFQYITNFNHQNTFILRPEIGITFFGSLNLSYGYNFMNHKLENVSANVLHLRFTKQNFRKNIKAKLFQFKNTIENDKEILKGLGIRIPRFEIQ